MASFSQSFAFVLVGVGGLVHVVLNVYSIVLGVLENAVEMRPVQKVELTRRGLVLDAVDAYGDALSSAKGVNITPSPVCQRHLVTMKYVEEIAATRGAHNVIFFGVVGDEPIESAQRDGAFLIDEWYQNAVQYFGAVKVVQTTQNALLADGQPLHIQKSGSIRLHGINTRLHGPKRAMNLIEEQPFHIVGQYMDVDTGFDYVQLAFTPTRTGWTQRSAQNGFNNEYVSKETLPKRRECMKCGFERIWHFAEEEAAAHFLYTKLSANPKSGLVSFWDDDSK